MATTSSPAENGKRVFNWKSKSCCWPADLPEELEFGILNPRTKVWVVRISVRWITENGLTKAVVHSPLTDWGKSPQFLDLAAKLDSVTQQPLTLPAFRLALLLASCNFEDLTSYVTAKTESELRQELREAEELVERLEDQLATGYYAH